MKTPQWVFDGLQVCQSRVHGSLPLPTSRETLSLRMEPSHGNASRDSRRVTSHGILLVVRELLGHNDDGLQEGIRRHGSEQG